MLYILVVDAKLPIKYHVANVGRNSVVFVQSSKRHILGASQNRGSPVVTMSFNTKMVEWLGWIGVKSPTMSQVLATLRREAHPLGPGVDGRFLWKVGRGTKHWIWTYKGDKWGHNMVCMYVMYYIYVYIYTYPTNLMWHVGLSENEVYSQCMSL
jgi:hypothetical protein